ncbi:MAG: rubrerythrin family protein [Nitratireductor sp.]|nr:rubrerythrin family protein [Nitratireductor sp.]MCC0021607.1 rubrerythrin family protein [Nitratireductor sp.]
MLTRLLNFGRNKLRFDDMSAREILALAITSEEDDARIYRTFAGEIRETYPDSAKIFDEMATEEDQHRRWLIDVFREKFGETIPLIRREHVAGFYSRKPIWLMKNRSVDEMRKQAADMEAQAHRFYSAAAKRTSDATIRKLLGDLARAEAGHLGAAMNAEKHYISEDVKEAEAEAEHRQFVLTYVQPGLAGLIDGSVSTLAPIFATAFATMNPWTTFLVGLAASVGAGISMGFTEVASDDGVISGRGSPMIRGVVTGIMTTLGGLGHALPYLIPDFWTATYVAVAVVAVELAIITFIQHKYMETPWVKAMLQIVLGGALVLGAGVLIGGG